MMILTVYSTLSISVYMFTMVMVIINANILKCMLLYSIILAYSVNLSADTILSFFCYVLEKIMFDISSEISTRLMINMKCQALFPLKKKYE